MPPYAYHKNMYESFLFSISIIHFPYRCEARSRTGCYGYREAELTVLDVTPLNSCKFSEQLCGLKLQGVIR